MMITKPQKALFILGGLDDDDLRWIIYKGKVEKLPPDKILIYEGRPINALYIILDGLLSVLIGADQNRELAQLSKGEVVGEISFIDHRPPLATVKTLQETEVLSIPRYELTAKLANNSRFASRFYQGISLCLAHRMRGTVRRLGYEEPYREWEELEPEDFTASTQDFLALAEAKFNWLLHNLNKAELR